MAGKGDANKKGGVKQGRDAQMIKELKEFSSTFKLGPDNESKKNPTSDAISPPATVAASIQVKSSNEATHLGTPPSSVGTTPPASDKGSKPGDKKDKDAAETLAE